MMRLERQGVWLLGWAGTRENASDTFCLLGDQKTREHFSLPRNAFAFCMQFWISVMD